MKIRLSFSSDHTATIATTTNITNYPNPAAPTREYGLDAPPHRPSRLSNSQPPIPSSPALSSSRPASRTSSLMATSRAAACHQQTTPVSIIGGQGGGGGGGWRGALQPGSRRHFRIPIPISFPDSTPASHLRTKPRWERLNSLAFFLRRFCCGMGWGGRTLIDSRW